jgi:hypothetical protein
MRNLRYFAVTSSIPETELGFLRVRNFGCFEIYNSVIPAGMSFVEDGG